MAASLVNRNPFLNVPPKLEGFASKSLFIFEKISRWKNFLLILNSRK